MDYYGKKVVVALSGGVDSCAAALLAKERGCEVVGATLDLAPSDPVWQQAWGCGSKDKELIRHIAEKMQIEHHFINAAEAFKDQVLYRCFAEYSCGRTPNPCVLCNPLIKFGLLTDFARSIGAEALLTGHYAKFSDDRLIVRGDDLRKDQSYFLYRLPRTMLDFIDFPVGNMVKSEVRALVEAAGMPTARRPDSQDACFVFPGETFADTLFRRFNGKAHSGNFIYQGKIVGRHAGIHRCTIGQRKGLNVALGVPAYVKSISPDDGNVELVTDQELLASDSFDISDVNFQCRTMPLPDEELLIQIRYRTPAAPGRVFDLGNGIYQIKLNTPARAVTPGQSAVIYRGSTLLGGGIIQ